MHFAFIAETLPNAAMTGAGCHLWSMTKTAVDAGHRITYVLVGRPYDFQVLQHSELEAISAELSHLGVTLVRLDATSPDGPRSDSASSRKPRGRWKDPLRAGKRAVERWYQVLWPTFDDYDRYFDMATIDRSLRPVLQRLDVDAIFVFAWGPIAAVRDLRHIPRLALPGDPTHLVVQERIRHGLAGLDGGIVEAGRRLMMLRRLPDWMLFNLSMFDSVAWSAAQHAAWLRSRGVPCRYIPTSAPDQIGPGWDRLRALRAPNPKPKLVHLGHLGGTAALGGLRLLMEALPILERELGADGFEMHFIGRQDLRPEAMRIFHRPSVRFRGHLDDLTEELLSADVFVAPSPVRYGMRTRVVTGLSFGCCVVAHETCALGNPELVHERNVLLGGDGTAIARCILRALGDSRLRQTLQQNARRTYEQFFAPHVASAQYVAELERIASHRGGQERIRRT